MEGLTIRQATCIHLMHNATNPFYSTLFSPPFGELDQGMALKLMFDPERFESRFSGYVGILQPAGWRMGALLPRELEDERPNVVVGPAEDWNMDFDFSKSILAIGMNGWNVLRKTTRWISFDVDLKPPKKKGITEDRMKELVRQLADISYVNVRTSTTGTGLHLYVFMDQEVPTRNHFEHRMVMWRVLDCICQDVGDDLYEILTNGGRNHWVYHKNKQNSKSFQCIRENTTHFPTERLSELVECFQGLRELNFVS